MDFSSIKYIFFDFNGTILDDVDLCYDIETKIFKEYNIKDVTLDFYLDNFLFPVKKYYELVGFDFNKIDYAKVSKEFMDEYCLRENNESWLYQGVKTTLLKLREKGYKLYILTASKEDILIGQLKERNIEKCFDGFAAASDIKASGKEGYGKLFLKNNNIDPSKACLIGDTEHDYEVALKLNMTPILFTKGHNSKKLLKSCECTKIDDFKEILKLF